MVDESAAILGRTGETRVVASPRQVLATGEEVLERLPIEIAFQRLIGLVGATQGQFGHSHRLDGHERVVHIRVVVLTVVADSPVVEVVQFTFFTKVDLRSGDVGSRLDNQRTKPGLIGERQRHQRAGGVVVDKLAAMDRAVRFGRTGDKVERPSPLGTVFRIELGHFRHLQCDQRQRGQRRQF